METAHGKSGNGSRMFTGNCAVVFVNEFHDIRESLFKTGIHRPRKFHGGTHEAVATLTGSGFEVDIAVGHDHNHWLCLSLCNEVVQNLCRSSQLAPGIFIASHTMKKIKHRKAFAGIAVVCCRRIDRHPTAGPQRGRIVPYLGQRTVGNIVHLIKVCSAVADNENVAYSTHIAKTEDIARVVDLQTVHDERIAVEFGRQRLWCGVRPYAVRLCKVGHERLEVADNLHPDGFRRTEAESDGMVCMDFGRGNRCLFP